MGIKSVVALYRNGGYYISPQYYGTVAYCYVTGCYAVTFKAKRGAEAVTLRGKN